MEGSSEKEREKPVDLYTVTDLLGRWRCPTGAGLSAFLGQSAPKTGFLKSQLLALGIFSSLPLLGNLCPKEDC